MVILKFSREEKCFKSHICEALNGSPAFGKDITLIDNEDGGFDIVLGYANDNDMHIKTAIGSIKYPMGGN